MVKGRRIEVIFQNRTVVWLTWEQFICFTCANQNEKIPKQEENISKKEEVIVEFIGNVTAILTWENFTKFAKRFKENTVKKPIQKPNTEIIIQKSEKWSPPLISRFHADYESFLILVRSLCDTLPEPKGISRGRPACPLKDVVFACIVKNCKSVAGRKIMLNFDEYKENGYINTIPHYNSISSYSQQKFLTDIIYDFIEKSVQFMGVTGHQFSVETTTFMIPILDEKKQPKLIKINAKVEIETKVITEISIIDNESNLPIESTQTYSTSILPELKKEFGDKLKSKTKISQINEILSKILAYNLFLLLKKINKVKPLYAVGNY